MAHKMTYNIDAVKGASDAAVERALTTIGGMVRGYAVLLCPTKTSNLKNSITAEMVSKTKVAIGTDVKYAPFVELGHHQEPGRYVPAIGKRLKNDWVPPKAFLRPAIENHRDEYENVLKREMEKG